MMSGIAEDVVNEKTGGRADFALGDEEKGTDEAIGVVADVLAGGLDAADAKGLDAFVHEAQGDIADAHREVGDDGADGAIGVLHDGFGDDRRLVHDEFHEGPARAGALLASDEPDASGLAADFLPVFDASAEDLADLLDGEGGHGVRGVHNDGDAVPGQDDRSEVVLLRGQLAGGHADGGGALADGLDAGGGPPSLDHNTEVGMLLHVVFGDHLDEGLNGGRAGNDDFGLVPLLTASERKERDRNYKHRKEMSSLVHSKPIVGVPPGAPRTLRLAPHAHYTRSSRGACKFLTRC